MNVLHLREKDILDKQTELSFDYIKTLSDVTGIHDHDFFELFMVLGKGVMHVVNGSKQYLPNGSFVFVRPSDIHFYEKIDDNDCKIINLAFSKRMMFDMVSYLEEGFCPERLLEPRLAPAVIIPEAKRAEIIFTFEKLNMQMYFQIEEIRTALRALLVQLFIDYFPLKHRNTKSDTPIWLSKLIYEMQKKENFIEGTGALKSLSDKSPEHLCRMFKKHINKTPTEFINQLRLNYAVSLLKHSDEEIIDIALNSGFESLSYFYSLFKKQYNMSPAQFRKSNRKTLIPAQKL